MKICKSELKWNLDNLGGSQFGQETSQGQDMTSYWSGDMVSINN